MVQEGIDVAGLLVYSKKKGPFHYITVPPFTPYLSPLLPTPLKEADIHQGNSPLNALIQALIEDWDAIRLHLHPTLTDVRAFNWSGWAATPLYTYSVCLTDDPISQWSKSAQRRFHQHRSDYSIVVSDQAEAAVSLAVASYLRQQRPFPMDRKRLLHFIHLLQPTIYYAIPKKGNKPEASVVLLREGSTAYYWVVGSEPGNAMTILLGHLFSELPAAGIKYVDMIGANTPSIAEFKRRLGGSLQTYYAVDIVPNKWFEIIRAIRAK